MLWAFKFNFDAGIYHFLIWQLFWQLFPKFGCFFPNHLLTLFDLLIKIACFIKNGKKLELKVADVNFLVQGG
jgi:hypothetical protein